MLFDRWTRPSSKLVLSTSWWRWTSPLPSLTVNWTSPAKSLKRSALITAPTSCSIQTKSVETKVRRFSWYLDSEDYRDYIKNFEWNVKKYMYSKPLLELCGEITKVWSLNQVNTVDYAQIRRNAEKGDWTSQLNQVKTWLLRKEGRRQFGDSWFHRWHLH